MEWHAKTRSFIQQFSTRSNPVLRGADCPATSERVLEKVRPYLISLVIYRKSPLLNGHIDWATAGQACGIEDELMPELKKQLRLGVDGVIKWLETAKWAKTSGQRGRVIQKNQK